VYSMWDSRWIEVYEKVVDFVSCCRWIKCECRLFCIHVKLIFNSRNKLGTLLVVIVITRIAKLYLLLCLCSPVACVLLNLNFTCHKKRHIIIIKGKKFSGPYLTKLVWNFASHLNTLLSTLTRNVSRVLVQQSGHE